MDKNVTIDNLLRWWVDGFVSQGVNSIDFNDNIEKFQKIYEIIEKKVKNLEENMAMEKLFDNPEYNIVIFLRNLFTPSNNCCYYGYLKNTLKQFCSSGKANLSGNKIIFNYDPNLNPSNISEKYKSLIQDISKVMIN